MPECSSLGNLDAQQQWEQVAAMGWLPAFHQKQSLTAVQLQRGVVQAVLAKAESDYRCSCMPVMKASCLVRERLVVLVRARHASSNRVAAHSPGTGSV